MQKHHLLHYRKLWQSDGYSKALRDSPGLVIPMDDDAHKELHRETAFVPPLGAHLAAHTKKLFLPARDPLRSIDELCFALEEVAENKTRQDIEKEICFMAIRGIREQLPYIKDGMI